MEWTRPLIWSPEAESDLENTLEYLEKNGRRMLYKIFSKNFSKHLIG